MDLPSPSSLLAAVSGAENPTTAAQWAKLARQAADRAQFGFSGQPAERASSNASRMFAPGHIQHDGWTMLLSINLSEIARPRPTEGILTKMPEKGWLSAGIKNIEGTQGPARLFHASQDRCPFPQDQYAQALTWTAVRTAYPPGWIGFEAARQAVWALVAQGDSSLSEAEQESLYTALERPGDMPLALGLGLAAHWRHGRADQAKGLGVLSFHGCGLGEGGVAEVFVDDAGWRGCCWDGWWAREV